MDFAEFKKGEESKPPRDDAKSGQQDDLRQAVQELLEAARHDDVPGATDALRAVFDLFSSSEPSESGDEPEGEGQ